MCEIKSTIKFSFSKESDKPTIGEAVNFVKSLDADHGQVDAIYRMAEESAIYVKWKSEEAMLHVLTYNSDDLMFHYANGKKTGVWMSHAQDYIVYVRIYGLPPEVADRELASVLGKYGKVKRIVREKIPVELCLDAYTGVRGVYMDVKKEIPSSLHFQNLKGNISYSGNKDKCFLCKEEGHRMNSCPKRKARKHPEKRQQEQGQSGSSSYAGAVAGGAVIGSAVTSGAVTGGVQSDNSHHDTIEMREEEIPKAAMAPTAAENSEDESSEDEHRNHPLYQLASSIAEAIKENNLEKKKELRKKAKEEEEAKLKSPPRKKKNFSLYKK